MISPKPQPAPVKQPTAPVLDVATLRMWLRSCGVDHFVGGARLQGAGAELLNKMDEILNAVAIHQQQPDLYVELPDPPPPPPPPVNRHIKVEDNGEDATK